MDRIVREEFGNFICNHGAYDAVVYGMPLRSAARSMVKTYQSLAELKPLVGTTVGSSDWLQVASELQYAAPAYAGNLRDA